MIAIGGNEVFIVQLAGERQERLLGRQKLPAKTRRGRPSFLSHSSIPSSPPPVTSRWVKALLLPPHSDSENEPRLLIGVADITDMEAEVDTARRALRRPHSLPVHLLPRHLVARCHRD